MSWKVVQQNSINSSNVEIELEQTYSWMNNLDECQPLGGPNENLTCVPTTCSIIPSISVRGKCDSYDVDLKFVVTKSTRSFTRVLNSEMFLMYRKQNWSSNISNASNRTNSLVTMINLNRRSRTGQINSSPITSMPSVITLPINTQQVIRIPMIDTDGDIVKCRWANRSTTYHVTSIDECASACNRNSNFTLYTSSNLDNNCTLVVSVNSTSYYVIAIQIEDFRRATSYYPSSSIPLQFLIRGINDRNDSLPQIIGEFTNGAIITVSANTVFSTSIIAKTGSDQIKITKFSTDIAPLSATSTSPVVRQNASIYSFSFTWTPTVDQIGTKQLYCTIATDDENRQSTQYCLNFIVVEKTGE